MKTIKDVKLGCAIKNRKGISIVIERTVKSITVSYSNGDIVKINYPYKDSVFHEADF